MVGWLLTVKECCGVDTAALYKTSYVPGLLQGPTLADDYSNADDKEYQQNNVGSQT